MYALSQLSRPEYAKGPLLEQTRSTFGLAPLFAFSPRRERRPSANFVPVFCFKSQFFLFFLSLQALAFRILTLTLLLG